MASFIWDRRSGDQIAWIENDRDVYSVVTKQKFATVRVHRSNTEGHATTTDAA
jgi:hypothetical protein